MKQVVTENRGQDSGHSTHRIKSCGGMGFLLCTRCNAQVCVCMIRRCVTVFAGPGINGTHSNLLNGSFKLQLGIKGVHDGSVALPGQRHSAGLAFACLLEAMRIALFEIAHKVPGRAKIVTQ